MFTNPGLAAWLSDPVFWIAVALIVAYFYFSPSGKP